MVLQETVKKQIHELLHKIKAGLGGTVGRVRRKVFTYSMVLISFYYTSVIPLLILLQASSPNTRQSNTARFSSVSMNWNIPMTSWLIQFLHWWSLRASSLHLVRPFPELGSQFHTSEFIGKRRQISSICTWMMSMSRTFMQSPRQRTRKLSRTLMSLKLSVSFTMQITEIYYWLFSIRTASSFPGCISCVVNRFMLWGICLTRVWHMQVLRAKTRLWMVGNSRRMTVSSLTPKPLMSMCVFFILSAWSIVWPL